MNSSALSSPLLSSKPHLFSLTHLLFSPFSALLPIAPHFLYLIPSLLFPTSLLPWNRDSEMDNSPAFIQNESGVLQILIIATLAFCTVNQGACTSSHAHTVHEVKVGDSACVCVLVSVCQIHSCIMEIPGSCLHNPTKIGFK